MNRLKKISKYLLLVGIFIGLSTTGALADGTEHLGTPSISIASGSGIVAKGTGLITQPGIIDIDIPIGTTVKQVLLYWEGQHQSTNGDNTISIDGNIVTGTLIGGPTTFFRDVKSSSYRADITGLDIVNPGSNSITVQGLSFDYRNNGAGIIVIYDDGQDTNIQLRDGNDLAYIEFAPPLDTTVTQTFTFESATVSRIATLSMFISSAGDGSIRPSVIEINVNGVVTEIVDELNSNDGLEWDTLTIPINVPAGVTSLSVRALSKNIGNTENKPASFVWSTAALSVPREIEVVEGRMTGGGSIFKGNMRITHGFEIHCDLRKPNNIEVNWQGGNNFHMTDLTSAVCTDDLGIDQRPPVAPLDTFSGEGTGKLNGVPGARIEFIFVDAGEPGKKDTANIKIWDDVNNLVLEVSGFLRVGNHQAHR